MKGVAVMLRIAVVVAFALASAASAHAGEALGRGDFEFFIDAAAFRNRDGSARQEIYLRLPSAGVRFKGAGGRFEARPYVSITLTDSNGRVAVKDASEMTLYADVERQIHFRRLGQRRQQRVHAVDEPQREDHSGGAARDREEQTLGEKLPHEASPSRAERDAHGDLATAHDGATR